MADQLACDDDGYTIDRVYFGRFVVSYPNSAMPNTCVICRICMSKLILCQDHFLIRIDYIHDGQCSDPKSTKIFVRNAFDQKDTYNTKPILREQNLFWPPNLRMRRQHVDTFWGKLRPDDTSAWKFRFFGLYTL